VQSRSFDVSLPLLLRLCPSLALRDTMALSNVCVKTSPWHYSARLAFASRRLRSYLSNWSRCALTLIGSLTLKKRGAQNSKGESGMNKNVAECRAWAVETFGRQNWEIHDAQIGWSRWHRPWEKTLRFSLPAAAQLGGYPCGLSVSGQSSHHHEQIMVPISRRSTRRQQRPGRS